MTLRRTNRKQDVEIQKAISALIEVGAIIKGSDGYAHLKEGTTLERVHAAVNERLINKGVPIEGGVALQTVEDFIELVVEVPLKKSRNGKGAGLLQLRADFEAFKAEVNDRLDNAVIE